MNIFFDIYKFVIYLLIYETFDKINIVTTVIS